MSEEETKPQQHIEVPSHLLKPDDNHRLAPVPLTLQALASIKGPVVLISVVGTQRGGKSTLLNLLHSRTPKPGFGIGHLMDPQTTGLWIWDRPHPRTPGLTILLMDTEGLDAPHVPAWYNWILSAVALLVSSVFIYQTKGQIDAHAVERLGVILQVAEQLKGGRQLAQEKAGHVSDKPHFLWLIRDHQLKMTKNPKDEMVDKLNPSDVKALTRYFQSYDCFPLPRPVDKESDLQNVESMSYEELKSEFREEYVVLERQLFQQVQQPAMLAGRPVTGETLASLISAYAESIQGREGIVRELTSLPTQWQMVARVSGERALKVATKLYREQLQTLAKELPVSDERLAETHEEAWRQCYALFRTEALAEEYEEGHEPPEIMEFVRKLEQAVRRYLDVPVQLGDECVVQTKLVGGAYHEIWVKNASLSRERCDAALNELYEPVAEQVAGGQFASRMEYDAAVAQMRELYQSKTELKGLPGAATAPDRFLAHQRRANDGARVELLALGKQLGDQLAATSSRCDQLEQRAADTEAQTTQALSELRQALQQTADALRQELKEAGAAAKADADRQQQQLRELLDEKLASAAEKIQAAGERLKLLEKPIAEHSEKLAALGPKLDAVAARVDNEVLPAVKAAEQRAEQASERDRAAAAETARELRAMVAEARSALEARTSEVERAAAAATAEAVRQAEQRALDRAEQASAVARRLQDEVIPSLRDQLARADDQQRQLANELRDQMAAADKQRQTEADQLQQRMQQAEEAGRSAAAAAADQQQQTLDQALDQVRQTLDQAQQAAGQQLADAVQTAAANGQRIDAIGQQLADVTEQLAQQREQSSAAQQQLQEYTDQLKAELDKDAHEKFAALRNEIVETRSESGQLQPRLEAAEQRLSELAQLLAAVDERAGDSSQVEETVKTAMKAAETREQELQRRLAGALKNSIDQAKADLEGKIRQAAAGGETADKRMRSVENLIETSAKNAEQLRGAVDAIWESLGQMASRIVNCESHLDRSIEISSQKAQQDPANRQQASSWLGKLRGGGGGGGGGASTTDV